MALTLVLKVIFGIFVTERSPASSDYNSFWRRQWRVSWQLASAQIINGKINGMARNS